MSKHTPGPWHLLDAESFEDQMSTTIAGTARHSIRGIYEPLKSETDNASAYALDEANARLIAAAPEMLEALEDALPILERDATDERGRAFLAFVRATVAKAKGTP